MNQGTGYLTVVGYSWAAADKWRRAFPDRPFLSVRYDGTEVWVAFEPKSAEGRVRPAVLQDVRRIFEEGGDSWVDDHIFLHQEPTIGAGHRFARRILQLLQSDTDEK